jgi:lipopolysaccharide transport system permease protein
LPSARHVAAHSPRLERAPRRAEPRGGVRGRPRYDSREAGRAGPPGQSSVATQQKPTSSRPLDGMNSSPRPDPPLIEIDGGPGHLSRASVRELWQFRDVLAAFVARQLRVRYKQAVVGAGWVLLQPLASAAIFALFLGRYAHVKSEGTPYLLFAIGLGVLMIVTVLYGISPTVAWVALPLPVLILAAFASAFALGLSSLNIYYRDVRYVLPFLIQFGLFASPIAYPLSAIPASWRSAYAILNPVGGAVDAVRRIVIHGDWPNPVTAFGALGWSLCLAFLTYALFKRLERGFSDRV